MARTKKLNIDKSELRKELNRFVITREMSDRLWSMLYEIFESYSIGKFHNLDQEYRDSAFLSFFSHDERAAEAARMLPTGRLRITRIRGGLESLVRLWDPLSSTSALSYVTSIIDTHLRHQWHARDTDFKVKYLNKHEYDQEILGEQPNKHEAEKWDQ